ncbi:hypothetical protein MOB65_03385 [Bacillus inaquosorum]|uniref:hypothetical protein n=1 Tax=Bacillus TaxID=1386 RepID=UPI0015854A90|nr:MULTISPECIES: hypothetical protein [Bacillus]MCY7907951.1 hypothetical protein [Bacillus inaquosorum]NUF04881.1 hypothetical protein [Bacillus rugosus]
MSEKRAGPSLEEIAAMSAVELVLFLAGRRPKCKFTFTANISASTLWLHRDQCKGGKQTIWTAGGISGINPKWKKYIWFGMMRLIFLIWRHTTPTIVTETVALCDFDELGDGRFAFYDSGGLTRKM